MLKDEIWTRRQITAEIKMIQKNHSTGRNTMKWNKRTRSTQKAREERWTIMGSGWNCLCGWMNLCAK